MNTLTYKLDMNKMLGFLLVANEHKSASKYSAKIGGKPGVKNNQI